MTLRLLFFLSVTFSRICFADGIAELSGSLLFHVNELMTEWKGGSEPSIPFSDEEELAMWDELAVLSRDSQVEHARSLFYQAKSASDYGLLKKSAKELSQYWRSCEPDLEAPKFHLCARSQQYPITNEAREQIAPYLIPQDHPMAPALDAIFTKSRATKNMRTFEDAGFKVLHIQPRSFILVASHKKLPNYLVKIYLDDEIRLKRNKPGWKWFIHRCEGARKIAKIIQKYKIKHFTVPNKYIYVLPDNPPPPKGHEYKPKIAILLVDDMHLLPHDENEEHWENNITEQHLLELYTVISRANGSSYRAGNIPFTESGKIAFIDTEYPNQSPDYKSIRHYLSHEMRNKWDKIVRNHGKL